MHGGGLFLFGVGLLLIGIFSLVRAESVVNFFSGESNIIPEPLIPVAIALIRITGLISLFIFIVLLCGIWTNS
jgi:hypothetical protein